MRILRLSRLKPELMLGPMRPRSALPYVIANTVLAILFLGVLHIGYTDPDVWESKVAFPHGCMQALVAGLGIGWFYRSNGGRTGEDFLPRLQALEFVLAVRFAITTVAVVALVLSIRVTRRLLIPTSWETIYVYGILLAILFWLRLGSHARHVAKASGVVQ